MSNETKFNVAMIVGGILLSAWILGVFERLPKW